MTEQTEVTHLCPACGEYADEAADCWNCHTPLVSPSPGFEYEFEDESVQIVERDGIVLTDSDGMEYTVEELANAIEQGDAEAHERAS